MYPGSRKHQDPSPEAHKARALARAERIQKALVEYRQFVDAPRADIHPDDIMAEELAYRSQFREDVEKHPKRNPKYNRMVIKDVEAEDPTLVEVAERLKTMPGRAINAGDSNVVPLFPQHYVNLLQEAPEVVEKQIS